jgi:hypothetical protein
VSQPFCVDDGNCGTAQIQKTEVIGADCSAVVSYQLLDLNGSVAGAWAGSVKQVSCEPMRVKVVDQCSKKSKFDREMVMLCAPDGTKAIVQNVTPESAPLGTAPVFEAYTLSGAPYAGSIAALTDCANEKVYISSGEDYCLNGVNFSRVDGVDVKTGGVIFNVWLNDAGSVVAAPVGATKGVCKVLEFDSEVTTELGCAASIQYSRVTRRLYDKAGTFVNATSVYINSAGASTATIPAGFTLGDCGCAPATTSGLQPSWGF